MGEDKAIEEEVKAVMKEQGQNVEGENLEELALKVAEQLRKIQEEREQREKRKEELIKEIKKLLPNFVDFKEDYDVEDLERIVEYLRNMRFDYAKRVMNIPARKRSFKNFLFLAVGTIVIGVVLFLAKITFWR